MTKIETQLIETVLKYRNTIVGTIITLLAIIARYYGRNFISGDMKGCLLPWFNLYRAYGLSGLEEQIGDYNLMYQSILAVMAETDFNPLYMIKTFSIVFDFVLAGLIVYIIKKLFNVRDTNALLIAYASVILLPTVVINSAYWGQIDAMYTVFVLTALVLLFKRKYPWAFFIWGIALGCKLQAIFILPFIAMLYLNRKDFSLLNCVYSIIAFWAGGLLAFANGRSFGAPIDIYIMQTSEYPRMFFNFPSFWVLFANNYKSFGSVAIVTTAAIMVFGLFTLSSRKDFENKFFLYATWTVWTAVLFLPKMHDRYGFLTDILLLLISFQDRRFVKYAAVSICLSIFVYGNYFGGVNNVSWHKHQYAHQMMIFASALYTACYCCFSYNYIFKSHSATGVEKKQ